MRSQTRFPSEPAWLAQLRCRHLIEILTLSAVLGILGGVLAPPEDMPCPTQSEAVAQNKRAELGLPAFGNAHCSPPPPTELRRPMTTTFNQRKTP